MITRPHAEVGVRILPSGGYEFAAALFSGAALADAAAPLAAEGVDPGPHLVGLVEAGAIANIR